MTILDSSLEAEQAIYSDRIERRRVLQDVATSDGVTGVSNSTTDPKKSRAAMFSGLEALADAVIENGKTTNHPGHDGKSGKPLGDAPPAPSSGKSKDSGSKTKQTHHSTPVGLAILQSESTLQKDTNKVIKSLSDMASAIMATSTKVTQNGVDWLQNYYKYGLSEKQSDSSGMGQWKKGTDVPGGVQGVKIKISTGHYYMSIDGGKSFVDLGTVQTDSMGWVTQPSQAQLTAAFPGYTLPTDSDKMPDGHCTLKDQNNYEGYWHSGGGSKGDGTEITMYFVAPDSNTGGTGIENSSSNDYNDKLSQYTFIEQRNKAANTAMQAVASMPSTMLSDLTNSINTTNQGAKTALSAVDAVTQMVQSSVGR